MPNQTNPFDSPLLKDPEKLEQLRNAPETQKVFSMLSRTVGGNLEQAADAAAKGDSTQLIAAIRSVMQTSEGAQLIHRMKEKLK